MARTSKKYSPGSRLLAVDTFIRDELPHLSGVLTDSDEFRELRLMARADGTTLAILKAYGSDGGELVCFGSGYGVAGCLLAIDATVQGGHWKVDKPWDGSKK